MAYDKQNPNKKTVMKKILSKLSVLALLALPVATSCELDQYSPTNPSPEEIVYTMPQAESWRLGLYTTLRSVYGFDISDLQTDNFVLTNQDGNQNGSEFNWTFNNNDNDRSTTVWANAYTTIFRANAVLENVPKVLTNATDLTAADTLEINQILGEAHLVRAMMYQRLATYFTDRYDRATASQQLGLPIVEVLGVDYMPARASLDSTYKYIRHELSLARSLMNGSDPSRYLSGDVVNYLLPSAAIDIVEARVELTTGNYAEAAAIAERLIASGAYPLATTTEELNDMWLNDRGSEIIFEPYPSTEDRGASWGNFTSLNASLTSQLGVNAYVPLIYPSNEAMSRYEATDIRFPATFFQGWSYAAYYATGVLFLLSVIIIVVVSLLTPAPDREHTDGLTYAWLRSNSEAKAEIGPCLFYFPSSFLPDCLFGINDERIDGFFGLVVFHLGGQSSVIRDIVHYFYQIISVFYVKR